MSISGLGRIATAEKMSVEQLQEALRNKSLPAYIGIPLLEEKMDMRDRMMKMQAMQQAQKQRPPIAEQIMQRAAAPAQAPAPMMPPGIDALPTQLASAEGYAGGGIVAFEDGGYVEPIRFQNEGLVPKTQEEIDREAMMDTLRRLKAAGMDIGTLPFRAIGGAAETAITRPLRALGVPIPYLPKDFYGGDPSSMTPYYDQIRKADEAKAAAQPPVAPTADAKIPDTAVAPPAPPAGAAPQGDQGIAAAAPLALPEKPKMQSATEFGKELLYGKDGQSGYFGRSEAREKELMESIGRNRLQGKAFEDYEKRLQKEGEAAGLEKDQAKYMALLKAGLSMMAGTSQHALENIGKGALLGAEDYQKAYKDIKKAERERTKEFALIEQARRAEENDNRKESNRLLERAADRREASLRFGTQAMMNLGIKDQDRALDTWKTEYAGGVQMRGQDMTLAAAKARMRPGFTMKDIAKYRSDAMKNVDENAIRAQVASQLKIKAPPAGQDKQFDAKVAEAYEAAIMKYLQTVLGGATNSATSLQQKGFSIVPGTE